MTPDDAMRLPRHRSWEHLLSCGNLALETLSAVSKKPSIFFK